MQKNHHNDMQAKSFFQIWPAVFFAVALLGILFTIAYATRIPEKVPGLGLLLFKGELQHIIAPRTGAVIEWLKEEGDTLTVGDKIAIIVDHKSDEAVEVIANVGGVIAEIIVFGGSIAEKGQTLAVIAHDGDPKRDLEITGFVSSLDGKKIEAGMLALVNPTITKPYQHGLMLARVKRVGKLPLTKAAILSIVKIPEVAEFIRGQVQAEPFVVVLEPIKNELNITGYEWSGPGPNVALDSGIFADFSIIVHEQSLLTMLMPTPLWPRMSL